jgi:hypothetical protein
VDYITSSFREDLRELERTHQEIEVVVRVLQRFVIDGEWPYELKNHSCVEPRKPGDNYYQSTNAMILFALVAAARRLALPCPLTLPGGEGAVWVKDIAQFNPVWERLIKETNDLREKSKEEHISRSASFGYDDPFTLTWLYEMARSRAFAVEAEFLGALRGLAPIIHGGQRAAVCRHVQGWRLGRDRSRG